MDVQNAAYWIEKLQLLPHPEGGYYREVFRSRQDVLRPGSAEIKNACTSIYYLLEAGDYSGFHRIASDELWYFHKGEPLNIHAIDEQGNHIIHELSDNNRGHLSVAIETGLWFAAEVNSGSGFTLVSCAVAPGFDFDEFEMAKKEALMHQFPQHILLLNRLCRK